MPLIDETEPKKGFKKRNQRPWDLLGEESEPIAAASEPKAARAPSPASDGTLPMLDAVLIPLERIHPDKGQVRRTIDLDSAAMAELADSIRIHGVRQPITVWKTEAGDYEIVFGERRFHAAKKAGLQAVPCILLPRRPSPEDKTALQLIENLHREDMSPLDEAAAYHALSQNHGMTHEQIAKKVGRARTHITKSIQLLNISPAVREQCATSHLGEKPLSFEHLLEIARQSTPEKQAALLAQIRSQGLSVKDLRQELKGGAKVVAAPEAETSTKADTAQGRSALKTHKFVDPEDRFWMLIHFKQAKIAPKDVQAALEKALADVKKAIARSGGGKP